MNMQEKQNVEQERVGQSLSLARGPKLPPFDEDDVDSYSDLRDMQLLIIGTKQVVWLLI